MKLPSAFSLLFVLVVAEVVAQINYSQNCANSIGTCQNACWAVLCTRATRMLTYDSNRANQAPRRRASGCSRNPCNNNNLPYRRFGNSCDEYPFASVRQGGAGAKLRCVPKGQNDSQGGQLSAFYRNSGIRNGQRYGVTLRNYGGAYFCRQRPTCTNDGEEWEPVSLRTLEDEDGDLHLVIAEDPDNPIRVGDEVWTDPIHGTVRLVREVPSSET
ncbi:uncharacterized protein BO95DRAFT_455762 [Aspergillus brunneoviolaceus CBS 621.78]|uniref:Uncharacterized protein n=1 Tax=Aspergillus brunneoviolaceus CBS 621.78 TaxID=1450534 RepID=A0ACD1FZW1_9EURO|nr:hypothetical protein BO95DRAFT_455762 [Aspergillus brunneoviolaceus CBS 621.78]RAH42516.1 hypothetical protein BO95DRAFT_455762 [Aspergillus brunneoviolaceus CBS 621.78]